MPRHANQTSFKPGNKRSPESIEKQRATMRAQIACGDRKPPRNPWTEDQRKSHAETKRSKVLGKRYLAKRKNATYWQVMTPTGRRYEHRVIMEGHLGRPLTRSEVVHHKNRDAMDNRIENLHLCASASEHRKLHAEEDRALHQ